MKKKILLFIFAILVFSFGLSKVNGDANAIDSCLGLNKSTCLHNDSFSCLWITNEFNKSGYCNVDNLVYISCGDAKDIPYQAPRIISFVVNFLKVMTPVILIITSIITLVKALATSKEDEIKKARTSLIRKLIAAALVFFVITIVQFVVLRFADSTEKNNVSDCLSCFLNNDCKSSAYYKTNIAGDEYYTYFSDGITYSENNKAVNKANTPYYVVPINTECIENGYFSNGYQPKAVYYKSDEENADGTKGDCHQLKNKDKTIKVTKTSLDGNTKTVDQAIWYFSTYHSVKSGRSRKYTHHCFYWNPLKNNYEKIDCNATSVTATK